MEDARDVLFNPLESSTLVLDMKLNPFQNPNEL